MNREILIDALEELDSGLIERYFEIKEKLRRKRIVTKNIVRMTAVASCIAIILAVVSLVLRFAVLPEFSDRLNIPIENIVFESDLSSELVGSQYEYTNWNGLDVSTSLKACLEYYQDNNEKLYVINVFRRGGMDWFTDYVYKGKTYTEYKQLTSYYGGRAVILEQLIENYGEILKYGREIITVSGIPQDDMLINPSDRGVCWSEELYDITLEYINEGFPDALSLYIVNGDFLSEKAQEDLDLLLAEYYAIEDIISEMREAYFCNHKAEDVALFENMGYITGKINGKLYIITSQEEFAKLGENIDASKYSFLMLSRDDFYAAYPVSDIPYDFEFESTVSGFDCSRFVFWCLRDVRDGQENVYVANDDEFYTALNEMIHKYKNDSECIEFQIHAKNEAGENYLIDISELTDMNVYKYYYWETFDTTIIAVRFEDLDLNAIRNLSLRHDIDSIVISHEGFACIEIE